MKSSPVKKRLILILLDHVLIFMAFCLVSTILGQDLYANLARTHPWLLIFLLLHLVVAVIFDKYLFRKTGSSRNIFLKMINTNLAFTGIASFLIIVTSQFGFPRTLFFGTVGLSTILEIPIWWLIFVFQSAKQRGYNYNHDELPMVEESEPEKAEKYPERKDPRAFLNVRGQAIRQSVIYENGHGAYEYLKNNVPIDDSSVVLSVNNRLNILHLPASCIDTIVNLEKVNNHRRVNKFFETVNFKLPPGGYYSGVAEPQKTRKKRFFRTYTPVFGFVLYFFDCLWSRVIPKLPVVKRLYFSLTKGKNRAMSRAEVLGRLYACGFEVVDETLVDGMLYFTARKVRNPHFDKAPTYGPLVRLRRVGKDGKIIGVYKMRTMHPFSEYIQGYVYDKHGTQDGDKITDDFRITTWGKIMRKLWIDELPMIYNWLNGDLKLVGVRPLSKHKFNTYPEYLQRLRVKFKPGLVPPYYADLPSTEEEFFESEERYIRKYARAPLYTDFVYFTRAAHNILFKNARSK